MSSPVLQRIAGGDAAAVRECIDCYGALVWTLARRLSRTATDAEDATLEIFLHIWSSAGRFDASRGSEQIFITMLARRRLIDRLRKTVRDPFMHTVAPWVNARSDLQFSVEAEQASLVLAALGPEHRQVLELSLLQGFSESEIATHLNMALGTVKSFIRRGLTQVLELLNDVSPEHYGAPASAAK